MFTTLISAVDLAAHRGDPGWVIFDCRHDLARPEAGALAFQAGHIAGAHFAALDDDLAGRKNGANGRHPLPDREGFRLFLSAHGVTDTSQIVAYDASGGMFAARLWWLARWIGHEAVAVLDGGVQAWAEEHFELETASPNVAAGTLSERPSRERTVAADTILAHLGDPGQLVIDARAPERYRGDVEPLDPVAGHIPNALNRFYQANLEADMRFKAAATLRAEFLALIGNHHAEQIVHQCGSGVTACHNLLAMEVAGLPGSALYPGSWSEWCADPKRPWVGPRA